jgi:hypothetical protein
LPLPSLLAQLASSESELDNIQLHHKNKVDVANIFRLLAIYMFEIQLAIIGSDQIADEIRGDEIRGDEIRAEQIRLEQSRAEQIRSDRDDS